MGRVAVANRSAKANRAAVASRTASTRGWTPKKLAPTFWHDCSLLAAGLVGTLPDQSGNGFAPAETTNKPTAVASIANGLTILRFASGSSTKLVYPVTQPVYGASWTLFIVCTASTDNSSYQFSDTANFNGIISRFDGGHTKLEWYENGAINNYVLTSAEDSRFHTITIQHTDGANTVTRYDRNPVATTAARTTTAATAVSTWGADAAPGAFGSYDLAETFLVPSIVSATNVGLAELYLSVKWGTK